MGHGAFSDSMGMGRSAEWRGGEGGGAGGGQEPGHGVNAPRAPLLLHPSYSMPSAFAPLRESCFSELCCLPRACRPREAAAGLVWRSRDLLARLRSDVLALCAVAVQEQGVSTVPLQSPLLLYVGC